MRFIKTFESKDWRSKDKWENYLDPNNLGYKEVCTNVIIPQIKELSYIIEDEGGKVQIYRLPSFSNRYSIQIEIEKEDGGDYFKNEATFGEFIDRCQNICDENYCKLFSILPGYFKYNAAYIILPISDESNINERFELRDVTDTANSIMTITRNNYNRVQRDFGITEDDINNIMTDLLETYSELVFECIHCGRFFIDADHQNEPMFQIAIYKNINIQPSIIDIVQYPEIIDLVDGIVDRLRDVKLYLRWGSQGAFVGTGGPGKYDINPSTRVIILTFSKIQFSPKQVRKKYHKINISKNNI